MDELEPLIADALVFARDVFEGDSSGHDYAHTLRVVHMATRLARAEGADVTIVQLAAALHDVDDRKLSPETHENLKRARDFMAGAGVDDETTAQVCQIIREVSFRGSDSVTPTTLEGRCVQDADRLDALGAIGVARAFAYGGAHGRPLHDPDEPPALNMDDEQYRQRTSSSLNHFHEKLFLLKDLMGTKSGRAIAEQRDAFMHQYVDEFLAEWDGER